MKNKLFALLFAIIALNVFSAPVSIDEATMAAKNWANTRAYIMTANYSGKQIAETWSYTNKQGKVQFHCVNYLGGGYIVTAANDTEYPVIAFSQKGSFKNNPKSPMWKLLSPGRFTTGATSPSGGLKPTKMAGDARHPLWDKLISVKPVKKLLASPGIDEIADVRVEPLLKTSWGQENEPDTGEYCYNKYTPENYPCGCVATAMAQLMAFHKYPTDEVEAKTYTCYLNDIPQDMTMKGGIYDWDKMLTTYEYKDLEPEFQETLENIGKLTYDCGVAARMNYAQEGSGSSDGWFINELFKNNFKYKNGETYIEEKGISIENLKKCICPNLDAGNPVSLSLAGYKTADKNYDAGHQILSDGYGYTADDAFCFHLNMGWDGGEDVWYVLPSFLTEEYTFTHIDGVIYNIFPLYTGEIVSGRVLVEGIPIVGAQVSVTLNGTLIISDVTNEKGIYSVIVPSDKTYELKASYANLRSKSKSVKVTKSVSYENEWDEGSFTKKKQEIGNQWGVDLELRSPTSLAEDETLISLEKSALTVKENAASFSLNVKRTAGKAEPVIIKLVTVDDTAKAGKDYISFKTNLCWEAGDTKAKKVTIPLLPDLIDHWEGASKQFSVKLESLSADSPELNGDYYRCEIGAISETVVTITESAKMNVGTIEIVGYDSSPAFMVAEDDMRAFKNPKKPELIVSGKVTYSFWLERKGGADGLVAVKPVFQDSKKVEYPIYMLVNGEEMEVDFVSWDDGDSSAKFIYVKIPENASYNDLKANLTLSVIKANSTLQIFKPGTGGLGALLIPYAAKLGTVKSVALAIRSSELGDSLEERIKKCGKTSPVTLAGTKGMWYFALAYSYKIQSLPVESSKKPELSYTVNGPGVLKLNYIQVNNFESGDSLTVTVGKEKAKELLSDPKIVSNCAQINAEALTFVVAPGKQTVKFVFTPKKIAKGQPARENGMPSLVIGGSNYDTHCEWIPTPEQGHDMFADKSVVSYEFSPNDFKNSLAALLWGDASKLCIAYGTKKTDLSYSIDFDFKPGTTYYWRADTVYEVSSGVDVIVTNKVVNSFTVAPVIAPVTTCKMIEGGEDVPLSGYCAGVQLYQGVKANLILGTEDQTSVAPTYSIVSGRLPAGLKLDSKTGVITGVPTGVSTNIIAVQAKAGKVGGVTQSLRLVVNPIPSHVVNTFYGEISGVATVAGYNEHCANVTFTVGKTGALSAKVLIAGKTYTFKGTGFDSRGTSSLEPYKDCYVAKLETAVKFGTETVTNTLDIAIDSYWKKYNNEATISAKIASQADKNSPVAFLNYGSGETSLYADRRKDATLGDTFASFEGYYTAAITVNDSNSNPRPKGHGYLTLTIDKNGNVKFSGMLSDGTAVSGSTVPTLLGPPTMRIPIHFTKNKTLLGGNLHLQIVDKGGNFVQKALMTAPLMWCNADPNSLWEITGQPGFMGFVNLTGGYYDKLVNLQRYYYELDTDLSFGDGDNDGVKVEGNKVIIDKNNSYGLTLSFTRATGIFTGSMTKLPEDTEENFKMSSDFANMIRDKKLKMDVAGVMIMSDTSYSDKSVADEPVSRIPYTTTPFMGYIKTQLQRDDAKKTKWIGSWSFEME